MPKKFNVAIIHGRTRTRKSIENYVRELGFIPRILMNEYSAETIFTRFRDLIWADIHCAVVLLTADDLIANDKRRARQNVVFELGYCFGAFDSIPDDADYKAENAIIVIEEEGVELFADITGVTTIKFERGKLSKEKDKIVQALANSFNSAKLHYRLKH